MRLGGRLAAAIDILADLETRNRTPAEALKDWGYAHRFAGSGDRAAIGNLVNDTLRRRRSIAFLMDGDTPSVLAHGALFTSWNVTPERLARENEADRFAPDPPSPAVLSAFAARRLADAPAPVQADVQDWLAPSLEANFSDVWVEEMRAMAGRPPLDLRVNRLKADKAEILETLAPSGARPCALAPDGMRIAAGEGPARLPNVTTNRAYAQGAFEVQDEGSQIAALLLGAMAGETVLDYCAGGGGKTLAIASAMGGAGNIHAFDADLRRLSPLAERAGRAGAQAVTIHRQPGDLAGLEGACDRVLVDAPCTGTGTWRRRPDTKWTLDRAELAERVRQQEEALSRASLHVRAGGELVYVTCSLLPEENEAQIAAFLEDNPGFALASLAERWAETFPADGPKPLSSDGHTVTLTPASTGTDGFFVASLVRGS
ncbi:RsmB/NOP family class I SAM-dependent RNA methyltransferase [Pararhizobium mangrovi]|uniref:RsmB/NOP family class I SAM-dependent RNA methyltransferase n=1 Tax=Pararhizobium mangrovi TaxID=2590452 RepID=A0A506U1Y8_9HYPH|nr:RsmB/NOP family class I SAM-dependent RNA methyltransferase [Pararhizobium mangrovi]TPW28383.1 RsmB/NOP family class I SAM-dependent RNA methyltransferase [Pararhizobium mangrovi]